jgi:hydroxyacylglutathione hydrolase
VTELTVTRLPAFDDNYLWMIHGGGEHRHHVAVVDPGDPQVIEAALSAHEASLAAILVTHHHGDHTGGVAALAVAHGCPVYGPASETIPALSHPLRAGDTVTLSRLGLEFRVMDVPGHTAGHIAYVGHGAVFCGDTLFSGGCGRLFEGTAAQMLASLDQLAALPDYTCVYCAHEYTAANLRFALAVEPDNGQLIRYAADVTRLRADGEATVPSTIGRERAINPFLRSRLPSVAERVWAHAGITATSEVETFRLLREWKNHFR